VAEGVASAPALKALAAKLGVETPICSAVEDILSGALEVDAAIEALLSRPIRAETL
jgi:glycerol-3-phosphate dehydrogenase (NAD(P)+)